VKGCGNGFPAIIPFCIGCSILRRLGWTRSANAIPAGRSLRLPMRRMRKRLLGFSIFCSGTRCQKLPCKDKNKEIRGPISGVSPIVFLGFLVYHFMFTAFNCNTSAGMNIKHNNSL
jgi:hypothetical protein